MGTTSSFFGGGGGDPLPQPEWLFQKSSYTYTFPYDGTVIVHVVGAGGSGAVQTSVFGATGGGAGGYSQKQFSVTSSTTATVTTGTGGLYPAPQVSIADGASGGNTTFVLGSDTLTANGGGGGASYGTATSVGAGGTASGGTINYTGGPSGARGHAYNDSSTSTGGGAVNLFNLNTAGGSNGTSINSPYSATGGGGVGGQGGDIELAGANNSCTAGGGSAGPATNIAGTSTGTRRDSAPGGGGARLFRFNGPLLDGVGGLGVIVDGSSSFQNISPNNPVGIGAGSGGMSQTTPSQNYRQMKVQPAGIFGGGGACYAGQVIGSAGDGTVGGGGGGYSQVSTQTTGLSRRSGRGGHGVVIIEYIGRG